MNKKLILSILVLAGMFTNKSFAGVQDETTGSDSATCEKNKGKWFAVRIEGFQSDMEWRKDDKKFVSKNGLQFTVLKKDDEVTINNEFRQHHEDPSILFPVNKNGEPFLYIEVDSINVLNNKGKGKKLISKRDIENIASDLNVESDLNPEKPCPNESDDEIQEEVVEDKESVDDNEGKKATVHTPWLVKTMKYSMFAVVIAAAGYGAHKLSKKETRENIKKKMRNVVHCFSKLFEKQTE